MRVEGIETVRRILCVFPRYTSSFGTFEYAYPLTDGVSAFMPPQGLLLIAAYLPENWPVRFIDENLRPATKEDFERSAVQERTRECVPLGKAQGGKVLERRRENRMARTQDPRHERDGALVKASGRAIVPSSVE